MKLYRSLIFRELKLTRKRCILMLILLVLLALLLMLPAILGNFSESIEDDVDAMAGILFFGGTVALVAGLMAGTNNGLQKVDISSGWKQYSYILPPTAKQQALSDLLVKLCYILLFGTLSVGYASIYCIRANCNAVGHILNIYLGIVSVVMLIDIAYSYIVMFAKDKNELKIFGLIAFVGAGLILKVLNFFTGDVKIPEQPDDGGAIISDEAFNRFMTTLGSDKTTLCVLAVFAVICVLFFLVMWRSHERKEP